MSLNFEKNNWQMEIVGSWQKLAPLVGLESANKWYSHMEEEY